MSRRRAVLLLTVMTAALLMVASPAWADATFIVNSTGDEGDHSLGGTCATAPVPEGFEGECTLRAAIQEANFTTAADTINFDIPSSGVQTITPGVTSRGASLPAITQPLTVDGYTQTGASPNTNAVGEDNAALRIRLDGEFADFGCLQILADDSVVRGLSITNFSLGLEIRGDNNRIEGNFIGTNPGGTKEGLGNRTGIVIGDDGVAQTSRNNIVGGTAPNGGPSPDKRNIVSGSEAYGVVLNGDGTGSLTTGNRVQGNYIGTTKDGTGDLGNSGGGILIGAPANPVGGIRPAAANVIAFNGGTFGAGGVRIFGENTGNFVLGNSIFSNSGLGIELQTTISGVTPNDGVGDADTGANNLQNFPVLSSATTGLTATTIKGTLKSTQNGTFLIQFFKNPNSARDEGKKFIGQKTVSDTDGDGIIPFAFKPKTKVEAGMFVTSTATAVDPANTGDTSEFSAPKKVQ